MKVKIRQVVDHGHEDERIILDVADDTEIGDYVVLDTTYSTEGKVTNKVRHPYWFPNQGVKKGDIVVLYTRKGNSNPVNKDQYTIWFYYWGLDSCVWNNDGDCAIIMHIDQWASHKVR